MINIDSTFDFLLCGIPFQYQSSSAKSSNSVEHRELGITQELHAFLNNEKTLFILNLFLGNFK